MGVSIIQKLYMNENLRLFLESSKNKIIKTVTIYVLILEINYWDWN